MFKTPAADAAPEDAEFIRRLPANWLRNDSILALVVAFIGMLSLQTLRLADLLAYSEAELIMAHGFSLGMAAMLVFYRRFPVPVVCLFTVLIFIGSMSAKEFYSLLFVGFMTIYSVGSWVSNRRVAFWVRFGVVTTQLVGSSALIWLAQENGEFSDEALSMSEQGAVLYVIATSVILSVGFYLSACYFGGQSWHRAHQRWKLQRAHDDLAAANQKIAAAAVHAERMHIARELHDIVAHHVTVMGVHASAARRLLEAGRDTTAVTDQLEHIETASAQAVQELQTMVYTLRDRDDSTEPLPDVGDLAVLVAQANSTEQTVSFEISGEEAPVSSAIALTLYRIVQEALTNTRKHAGPQVEVRVHLHYGQDHVTLSVTDNGKAYEPVASGTGTGLQGMVERVQAVDGTIDYGPHTPYGWKVVVRVPCTRTPES